MSTLKEAADAVRAMRVSARLRHYPPHPLAPTDAELEAASQEDPRERSFERVMEDETGIPAVGPI